MAKTTIAIEESTKARLREEYGSRKLHMVAEPNYDSVLNHLMDAVKVKPEPVVEVDPVPEPDKVPDEESTESEEPENKCDECDKVYKKPAGLKAHQTKSGHLQDADRPPSQDEIAGIIERLSPEQLAFFAKKVKEVAPAVES